MNGATERELPHWRLLEIECVGGPTVRLRFDKGLDVFTPNQNGPWDGNPVATIESYIAVTREAQR